MITASKIEAADGAYWVFEGSSAFRGLGNVGTPALAGFLPVDSKTLCQAINTQIGMAGYMGWDWYPNPNDITFGHFIGTYTFTNSIVDDGGTWKNGQMMGCLQQGVTGTSPAQNSWNYPFSAPYFFYVVLLVR